MDKLKEDGLNVTELQVSRNPGWVVTDPDSFQVRRKATEFSPEWEVYELYQIQEGKEPDDDDPRIYRIAHAYIFENEINVESVLGCYGYDSLSQVQEIYGEEWKSILAECQFEMDAGCLENLISMPYMTLEEAKKFIQTATRCDNDL